MSADKRPQLINAHFMIILLLMIAAVVLALTYKADNFEAALDGMHADALSVAYLKTWLQAKPGDQDVRLKLAREYLASGAWPLAEEVIKAGDAVFRRLPQVQWLMFQLKLARYRALPADPARQLGSKEGLAADMKALPVTTLTVEQLAQLADISLQLNLPQEAVRFYALAAARQPKKDAHWYAEAARCALLANRPSLAGEYYEKALRAAHGAAAAVHLAEAAAGAYTAADRGARALSLLQSVLRDHPRDAHLLSRAVALALARQQPQTAFDLNKRYLRLRPHDRAALVRQIQLAMQMGQRKEALDYSRAYIRLAPGDLSALRRHAALAEWNGRYAEALKIWQELAAKTRDPRIYRQLQMLAQNRYHEKAELAALDFLSAQPKLEDAEILRMAQRYEYLGYPEKADALLSAHAKDRSLLTAQASLRERMGDLTKALESRRQLAARSDSRPADTVQVARLLWRLGRGKQAYQAIRRLPEDYQPADRKTALLLGELGWRNGDYRLAAAVYQRLWQAEKDDDFARRRMILAYRELGRSAAVIKLLQTRWRRTGDPADLRMALQEARQANLWPTLGRLLDLAGKVEEQFASDSSYWQIRGDWYTHRQEYQQAFQAFQRAFQLDPRSTAAADGILWSLINAGDRKQLAYWADRYVDSGLPPGEGYAVALQELGRYREALTWYQARLDQHRNDALWLLNLADLLDAARRADAAMRVRRHALEVLMTRPGQVPKDRQATLIATLKGVPAAERWLKGQAGPAAQAALFNWWLQRQNDDAARFWLLRHHIERTRLPAWQRLQLAMNRQDRPAVAELLQHGLLTGAGDRMTAYAFLDRHDLVLAEAGDLETMTPDQREAAAAAASQTPNFGEVLLGSQNSDGLDILDKQASWWTSRQSHSWNFTAMQSDFQAHGDSGLAFDPASELSVDVGWRLHEKDLWALDAGLRDGNGGTVIPVKFLYRSAEGRRWQVQLNMNEHTATETSTLLHVLGDADSFGAQMDYHLDPRLMASLSAGLHRYQSLAGSSLADGQTAGLAVSYRLAGDVNPCLLSLETAWEGNSVVDRLPKDLQPLLAPDVGPTALVPESYRDVGISLHLGHGDLRSDFPQVASPRWSTDLWLGYVEPGGGLAVAASSGIGINLSGSDELSLKATYNDRMDRTAVNQHAFQLQLAYRYYFGR